MTSRSIPGETMESFKRVCNKPKVSIHFSREEKSVRLSFMNSKISLTFVEFISLNEKVQVGLAQINTGKWVNPYVCLCHRSFSFSIDLRQYEEFANEMDAIASTVTILTESEGSMHKKDNYVNEHRGLSTDWFYQEKSETSF